MSQKLEQTQTTVQTQQLQTMQVAVAKMVELPVAELAERVRNEMLDNAALEEKDDDDFPEMDSEATGNDNSEEQREDDEREDEDEARHEAEQENSYEETDDYGSEADAMGDYFSADDVPDYLQQRAEAERDRTEMQISSGTSFYDELESQIREHNLNEHEQQLMEYLIGSLDEDGFLRKDLDALVDELAIYHNIETTRDELERLLHVLQEFEPRGIGARSLQECLHIQLADPDNQTPYRKLALEVVDRCFKDLVSRHWFAIMQRLHIDDEALRHIRHILTHLNPMPGSALGESAAAGSPTVTPDFYVSIDSDGNACVTLNNGDVPELRVSRAFRESIKQYGGNRSHLNKQQKDAYTYARQKVDAAQSFINLINRRKTTLLSVMNCIVQLQRPFFDEDDEQLLRPLTLKDVAGRVGIDISTVSRVTSSKYVQTAYGIYPLKFFFSTQFTSSEGDELSARQVRNALKDIIEAEDKKNPLSDEALAQALCKRGFNVARRTVAKYRDMLGLPTARLRKE